MQLPAAHVRMRGLLGRAQYYEKIAVTNRVDNKYILLHDWEGNMGKYSGSIGPTGGQSQRADILPTQGVQ